MTTITADERAAIRDSFNRLMTQRSRETDVRRTMETPEGYDRALWREIADMGITGLLVDSAYGGVGAGPVELEIIMEEAGAALLCSPLLSSCVLAASLLSGSTDDEARSRLLPPIASGASIAAVALTGERGLWTPEDVAVTASRSIEGWVLDGVSSFVLSANVADILLVVARTPGGLAAFEVTPSDPAVLIEPLASFDRTLRLSRVSLRTSRATPIAGVDAAAIEKTLDFGRVALAGEQAGGARRIFDITIDYMKTRVQFGRPIGGFQALKHIAADLLIEVESATSAARHAAHALADGSPETASAVNLAAFACADAFSEVAAQAIQMHGGIAFTWEHPAHLYLRRARADAQLLGPPESYRERFVSALEQVQ